jgi:hypothetical protein
MQECLLVQESKKEIAETGLTHEQQQTALLSNPQAVVRFASA